MLPPLQNPKYASEVNMPSQTKWRNVGWKTSTFLFNVYKRFFCHVFTFFNVFLNFIWNVFYIYGFINQYLFASEHVDLFSDCWFTFSFLSRLLKAKTSKCWTLFGKKKRRWIGHILRKHDGLLHEIIEGKMEGKTTRGRRRFQMLYDSANDGGFVALKRTAEDREGWRHRKDVKNLLYSRRLLMMMITLWATAVVNKSVLG